MSILLRDRNRQRKTLSLTVVYVICLINMMKIIFSMRSTSTNNVSTKSKWMWMERRLHEITLLPTKRSHTHTPFIEYTGDALTKGVWKNLRRKCNTIMFSMRLFGCKYDFNENYHRHVLLREISSLQRVINLICSTKLYVLWVCIFVHARFIIRSNFVLILKQTALL